MYDNWKTDNGEDIRYNNVNEYVSNLSDTEFYDELHRYDIDTYDYISEQARPLLDLVEDLICAIMNTPEGY
jgi:hypothetical protein